MAWTTAGAIMPRYTTNQFEMRSAWGTNPGTTPSSSEFGNQLGFYMGPASKRVGFIRGTHYTDGRCGIEIEATSSEWASSSVYNGLHFAVKPDGTPYVEFTQKYFALAGIGITSGTGAAPSSGSRGTIYIRYQ